MGRAFRIIGTLLGLALIALIAAGWFLRDYVTAYLNYRSAPEPVKTLERQSHFSREGQRYYYATAPKLVDKAAVQKACASVASEGLLGCYDGRRIYLLDITDPQFGDEEPVTAAHEMLHAAYDDLSPKERERVEGLLSAEIDQRRDADLNERIGKYQDRASQLDEAFAILGSEVADQSMSEALAREYRKYFTDRGAVIALHQKFEGQFDQFEARITNLKAELESKKRQLDRDLANGNVERYNGQVESYNELVGEHNQLIQQYNDLGQRFNKAISR